MDDARIKQLTEEVIQKLGTSHDPELADLEGRVAALEKAVRRLQGGDAAAAVGPPPSASAPSPAVLVAQTAILHPSLQVFGPKPQGERCCLEPDKPCVGSGQCRAFGH